MPRVRVATTQFAVAGDDVEANLQLAEAVVRAAAADGAKVSSSSSFHTPTLLGFVCCTLGHQFANPPAAGRPP